MEKNDYLFGMNDCFIDRETVSAGIHQQALVPFLDLCTEAAKQGFDLTIASAYRDCSRQLSIWNAKAEGLRPVLDDRGEKLDISALNDWQKVQAILRWSALPGASRHHWGTDIDVYDRSAVPENYAVQLIESEVQGDGPFVAMHDWIDQQIDENGCRGFFRPYQFDRGGIAPERWHLSYAPVAKKYQDEFTIERLLRILNKQPLALKQTVVENIEEIYERYIVVDDDIYPVC